MTTLPHHSLPQRPIRALGALLLAVTFGWMALAGSAQAQTVPDLETRNEPIRIPSGLTISEDVESRNGAITIGENAQVGDIETRNGAIVLDEGAQSGSIETRNGAIRLRGSNTVQSIEARNGRIQIGASSAVERSVETRNGPIQIGTESTIGGNVETRNGPITTEEAVRIAGEVETRNGAITLVGTDVEVLVDAQNGDISLREGTVIRGNVLLLMSETWGASSWSGSNPPTLRIDSESSVQGRLIVDERARVEIESGADVPEVERFASREAWDAQQ